MIKPDSIYWEYENIIACYYDLFLEPYSDNNIDFAFGDFGKKGRKRRLINEVSGQNPLLIIPDGLNDLLLL